MFPLKLAAPWFKKYNNSNVLRRISFFLVWSRDFQAHVCFITSEAEEEGGELTSPLHLKSVAQTVVNTISLGLSLHKLYGICDGFGAVIMKIFCVEMKKRTQIRVRKIFGM